MKPVSKEYSGQSSPHLDNHPVGAGDISVSTDDAVGLSASHDFESNFSSDETARHSPLHSRNSQAGNRLFKWGVWSVLLLLVVVGVCWYFFSATGPSGNYELTHTVTRGDLKVTVVEKGTLESSNNTEIKCKVRGYSVVIEVVEGGTFVQPGDVLVRLDTKRIDDAIGKHSTDAHVARATYERTKADVAKAEIAIEAYLEGTYVSQLKALKQRLSIAEESVENAERNLKDSVTLFRKGFVSEFEVESNRFALTQANLELKIRQTAIKVLTKYTKAMELESLNGNLNSLRSKLKADTAGLAMDEGRRDRAIRELEYCVIRAERAGLVIHPSSAAWKNTPDVAEGVNVRHDQVLLLMPDLDTMQVKVGIHESLIDRVQPGLIANITLPEIQIQGQVKTVAAIAQPAGWWTGNVVKYDTIIDLPKNDELKPGMTAEVEVVLAEHTDVLTLPVSAIVETERHKLCWVKTPEGAERRILNLGDSNDVFVIVEDGVKEGDEVILNPLQTVADASGEAMKAIGESDVSDEAADSKAKESPEDQGKENEDSSSEIEGAVNGS